jgi:hypothetical protein
MKMRTGTRDIERDVDAALLHDFFRADFENGIIYWKPRPPESLHLKTWNTRFAGKPVTRENSQGVIQVAITINGVKYMSVAHRVLWAMKNGAWPGRDVHIDHIQRVASLNKIRGLRVATPTQNAQNKGVYKNSKSGFKGVSFYERYGNWTAKITINKRTVHLGYFSSPRLAAEAYDKAAISEFGDFACTNRNLGLL